MPAAVPGVTGAVAVAAGNSHSVALFGDGSMVAWGDNASGQLGVGDTTRRIVPTPVVGPSGSGVLTGVRAVSAGTGHSVVARADGRVFAWGGNSAGQLGDGTTTGRLVPTAFNAPNAVSAVGAGGSHTLAVNGAPLGRALTDPELRGGGSSAARNSGCAVKNVGAPVTTSTGNFWHTFADLAVAGRGPGLAFTRTYNSSAGAIDGPFGFGWSSAYGMKVATSPNGAVVTEENGAEVAFVLSGGLYVSSAPRNVAGLVSGSGGFTYTRRNREIFGFDAAGRLTSVADRNGYATTIAYPSASLTTVIDSAGRMVNVARNGSGRVTSLTEAQAPSRTVGFSYNAAGELIEVVDVNGGRMTFGYDGAHRMLRMREPKYFGDTTTVPAPELTNIFDVAGKVSSQTDPLGRTTTFDYAPAGAPAGSTLVTDPKGNRTLDTYSSGLLVSHTSGYGTAGASTWTKSYDPTSIGCVSTTDPNGRTTTATFDGSGNRTGGTDALGRSTAATYNAFNDPLTVTDAKNVTTTFTYDSTAGNGAPGYNLASVSTPLRDGQGVTVATRTTAYRYLERGSTKPGDVTTMIDPDANAWLYDYAPATGDLIAATDPLGNKATSGYDNAGRRTSAVAPRGNEIGATPGATPPRSPTKPTTCRGARRTRWAISPSAPTTSTATRPPPSTPTPTGPTTPRTRRTS